MPRIPDVDRRVRRSISRAPRRGADNDALDVDRHLIAFDLNLDLVGLASLEDYTRGLCNLPLAAASVAVAAGLRNVQSTIGVEQDRRKPLAVTVSDRYDRLPLARDAPVVGQRHRECELVVLERIDGGHLVALGSDDGTRHVQSAAVRRTAVGLRHSHLVFSTVKPYPREPLIIRVTDVEDGLPLGYRTLAQEGEISIIIPILEPLIMKGEVGLTLTASAVATWG